jgi:dynactin 1
MKELKAQRALVKELQEGSQTEAELRESFEEALVERELADEKAAALEAQVHDLVEKVQGLEADNEILLEEAGQSRLNFCDFVRDTQRGLFAAKYDQPAEPGEERSSVALIQLERQNERLKEALVR